MPDEAIESEQAMKDFSKAIESKPEYVDAHLHRGVVYIQLALPTAACDDFYQVGLLSLKESNKTKALGCVDMIKKPTHLLP